MNEEVIWQNVIGLAAAISAIVSAVVSGAFRLLLRWWDRRAKHEDIDRDEGTGRKMSDIRSSYDEVMDALRKPADINDWSERFVHAGLLVSFSAAVGLPHEFLRGCEALGRAVQRWRSAIRDEPSEVALGDESEEFECRKERALTSESLRNLVLWAERIDVPMRTVYEMENTRIRSRQRLSRHQRKCRAGKLRDISTMATEVD